MLMVLPVQAMMTMVMTTTTMMTNYHDGFVTVSVVFANVFATKPSVPTVLHMLANTRGSNFYW